MIYLKNANLYLCCSWCSWSLVPEVPSQILEMIWSWLDTFISYRRIQDNDGVIGLPYLYFVCVHNMDKKRGRKLRETRGHHTQGESRANPRAISPQNQKRKLLLTGDLPCERTHHGKGHADNHTSPHFSHSSLIFQFFTVWYLNSSPSLQTTRTYEITQHKTIHLPWITQLLQQSHTDKLEMTPHR